MEINEFLQAPEPGPSRLEVKIARGPWRLRLVSRSRETVALGVPRGRLPPVCMRARSLSDVRLFGTPWTAARQAPLSMGFSRQEYWSGLPFPPPGDLPNSEIEPESPVLAGGFFTTEPPGKLGMTVS